MGLTTSKKARRGLKITIYLHVESNILLRSFEAIQLGLEAQILESYIRILGLNLGHFEEQDSSQGFKGSEIANDHLFSD